MTKTSSTEHKSEQAAMKHFKAHDHILKLAVIHKGDTEAQVSVFTREGQREMSVAFPLDYDLEYAAQQFLRRMGARLDTIIYT